MATTSVRVHSTRTMMRASLRYSSSTMAHRAPTMSGLLSTPARTLRKAQLSKATVVLVPMVAGLT